MRTFRACALAWVGLALTVGCGDSKRDYSNRDPGDGGTSGTTGGSNFAGQSAGGGNGASAGSGNAGSGNGGSAAGGSSGNGQAGDGDATSGSENGGSSGEGGTTGVSDAGEAGSGGTGLTIPVEPGRPGTTLVSGGKWMQSETYRGFSITSQSELGVVGRSEGYRIHGGIVGATQPGPAVP